GVENNLRVAKDAFDAFKKGQKDALKIDDINGYSKAVRDLQQTTKQLGNLGLEPVKADMQQLRQTTQQLSNVSVSATSALQGMELQTKRMQNTTFAFNQVLREAPAFAYSFQTGLMGISNNLPILADNLKAARAAGVGKIEMLKGLAGALISPLNLIGIGIALLPTITKLFSDKEDKVKNTGKALKDYAQHMSDANRSVAKEIVEMRVLVAQMQDANRPMNERLAAMKNLQEQYPTYLANISKDSMLNGDLSDAIDKVTKSLRAKAMAMAAMNKMTESQSKILDAQKEKELLQTDLPSAQKDYEDALKKMRASKRTIDPNREGLDLSQINIGAATNFRKANEQFSKAVEEKARIVKRIKELNGVIKDATKDLDFYEKLASTSDAPVVGGNTKPMAAPKPPKKDAYKSFFDRLKTFELLKPDIPIQIKPVAPTQAMLDRVNEKTLLLLRAASLSLPVTLAFESNEVIQSKIEEKLAAFRAIGNIVNQTISQPMQAFFDTLLSGSGNALQSFGRMLSQIIKRLIATAAAAAAVAGILSLIPGFTLMQGGKSITGFKGLFKAF
ncbi:MAG: hypothetical protein EAY68_10075, partial [Bacteroidetes bacterium]